MPAYIGEHVRHSVINNNPRLINICRVGLTISETISETVSETVSQTVSGTVSETATFRRTYVAVRPDELHGRPNKRHRAERKGLSTHRTRPP